MTALLPLFVALPLLVAGVLVGVRMPRPARRTILLVVLVADLVAAGALLARTWSGAVLVEHVGGWAGGLAIPLVADAFSALMLVTTVLLTTLTVAFACATGTADEPFFAPLVLLVTAGVNGALLTADLFNLFVFIEIMLLPSYGLILLAHRGRGSRQQVTASRIYVTVNLLTSTIFLVGVALIYAGTGRVSLGDLHGAAHTSPTALLGTVILLSALGIKAAVFPAHGWLGQTYPSMPPVVTALFSALHTKVAVYALFRVGAILFGETGPGPIALAVFTLSMIVGVLAAIGENDSRSILSFHMVSQIGYVLLGLALFTPAGLAAGVFYLVHNILAKGALFLSVAAVEDRYGRSSLGTVTGLLRREPLTAAAFFGAAISLAGLPPFSGFVAKLAIITASFSAGQWLVGAAALGVSLYTLMSMLKIWGGTFLGAANPEITEDDSHRIPFSFAAPALVLVVISLVLGVGGQLLLAPATTAAQSLIDPTIYLQEVSGR